MRRSQGTSDAGAGSEPASGQSTHQGFLARISARRGSLLLAYALTASLAFPIAEAIALGRAGPQFAHDVFDEGVVTRLGVVAADWRQHGLSLWNPYLTGGNAWLAQFGQPPVSLDVLLSCALSPFASYALTYYLIVLAAGFAMHLFLRDSLRLPAAACFAGGLLYQLGFWHYVLGWVVPLLPATLWLADRSAGDPARRRSHLAAGVFGSAFLFYNSHAQLVLLVAVAQLAWIAFGSSGARRGRAREWLFVWLLGAALYGPVLATQLELLPGSQRSIWDLGYLLPTSLGSIAEKTASLYGSVLVGVPVGEWLGHSPLTYGTFFAGLTGLPLLMLALLKSRRSRRERLLLWLPGCILVLELAYLLSLASWPWQEHLGLGKSFQITRVRHFLPFALAANAAIGLAALQRHQVRRVGASAGWLLWTALALLIGWQGWASAQRLMDLPPPDSLPAKVRLLGWLLASVYFGLGGAAWLGLGLKRRTVLRATRTGLSALASVIVLLVLADRLLYTRIERLVEPRLNSFAGAVEGTPGIGYLRTRENEQAHRVLSVDEHPNRLMFSRLYVANGYQQVYPLRYHQLFALLTAPHLDKDPWARDYIHRWGNRAYVYGPELNLDIASLMGIRWIYSLETSFQQPALVERFRAEREIVYENLAVFPRAFLAHGTRAYADRRQLLEALSSATAQELRTRAYILEQADLDLEAGELARQLPSMAEIVTYGPDRVEVETLSASAAVLVLTDVNAPGWRCYVNGVETEIFDVYNVFRGVVLEAGAHRVEYRYLPAATARGAWLAAAALLATAAWLLALSILERRRRRSPPARSECPPASEAP